MNAKGHIITGITTGMTAGVLVSQHENILISIAAMGIGGAASILTSQLPDLDSPNSKISQKIPIIKIVTNKAVTATLMIVTAILAIVFVALGANIETNAFKVLMISMFTTLLQVLLSILLSHRKLTHTLIFNGAIAAALLYPYRAQEFNTWYLFLATGLIAGLASHLIYDTATVKGCPLLFPLSSKNISPLKFLKLKSGKYDGKGIIFSIGVLISAIIIRIILL